MKRIHLFLFLTISIQAQINTNEFIKAGFTDMFWLEHNSIYYGCSQNFPDYAAAKYYYPELEELGLNYVVTMGNPVGPLNPSYNSSIKIIDRDFGSFQWSLPCYEYGVPGYDLSRIAYSTGNDPEFYAYEAGGDGYADPSNSDYKFGFGDIYNEPENLWKYSFWLRNRDNTIGDPNKDDLDNSIRVFYAGINEHSTGYILRGEFHPLHQNTYHYQSQHYYLMVRARINQIQGGDPNDVVATVYFSQEVTEEPLPESPNGLLGIHPVEENPELPTPPYDIKALLFTNGNNYIDLKIPFIKTHDPNNWGNMKMKIDIEWKDDTRDLYIDNISIFNRYYDSLFIRPANIQEAIRNRIKSLFINNFSIRSQNPLWAHPYQDEAMPLTYRCLGTLSDLAELPGVLGPGKYVTGVNNSAWFNIDEMRFAYSIKRFPFVFYDDYPIAGDVDYVSTNPPPGMQTIQSAWDRLISFDWGFDPIAGQRRNGLRHSIEIAQNYTKNDLTDDVPFYHTLQSCAYKNIVNGIPTTIHYREPTPNEIFAQAFLATCYGAKGVMYFTIFTNTPNYDPDTLPAFYGLFESEGYEGQVIQNPNNPQVTNTRYDAVKFLNKEIDKISSELLSLTWKDAFSFHKDTERQRLYSETFITDVQSVYYIQNPDTEVPDPVSESFVEIGVFKKSTEYTNDFLDYFMLVNRRGLEDEGRTYKVTYDKTGSQYVNWSVTDIATGNYWSGLANNMFAVHVDPGKGKLFSLEPTVIGGGSLYQSETIQNNIDLKRDLNIESGATLYVNADYHCYGNITLNGGSIFGNGKIIFHNNKRITVAQGTSQIYGSLGLIEIDFTAPHHMNGIQVMQNTNFRVWNCIIRNARVGITAGSNVSYFRASNVYFFNCVDGGINIYGPLSSTPVVSLCQFNSLSRGVMATNLSEILVAYNQFINNNNGITLINVTNPYINNNSIASNKKILPGIFLESCNGVIRNNTISGHTNAILLGNSSPAIGVNQITNNLYHGIYVGIGSMPQMNAKLFYDPPLYYPISGYNQIWENGGTITGGPPDNDGSEIFFNNSNADMQKGCNSIYDDREGSEHPPYNTRLLMNGIGFRPIRIQAEANFWSDHPQYPLAERFGNLIVDYDPFLLDPCEIPGGGSSEELFVKSSTGEVIDTLYSVQRTVENLTSTDLLYAVAEEKFISADYIGAEERFNQIVNGSDSLEVKLPAYRRLYDIGKLSLKPESYFNNLNNVYSSLVQSTNDSLMINIFNQLGSLSLVGEEEYIQAIEEFDDIIQQNPGSEKAVYAEIDAYTTALLIEKGDTTLGKSAAQNYIVNSSEYESKISNLLKNNFGAPQKTEETASIPANYNLYQNYPNPFNPVTTIKYDLVKNGNVKLAVYDILGREITILVNEQQQPGRYEVHFNASNLSSGVYIYQLISDEYMSSKKMILVK